MPRHIEWKKLADELIRSDWGNEGDSPSAMIKKSSDQRLIMVLLIDIAQSLRVLRCSNFRGIPWSLEQIQRNTKKVRKKRKKKSVEKSVVKKKSKVKKKKAA